mgnify:CR=1 FL=1
MAGLNERPSSERPHIAFFGMRNAGKSSLVNAVTNQQLSLVSDIKGTTTDPVQKAMEILPLGPVVIIDTPGMDDEGALGELRIQRAIRTLDKTDIAVLVIDAKKGKSEADSQLEALIKSRNIPLITVFNKSDLLAVSPDILSQDKTIYLSSKTGSGVNELKSLLGNIIGKSENDRHLVSDIISPGDIVVLVTPIDESAPKGRMILPQQQVIRDVLDGGAVNVVTKESELEIALSCLKNPPRMVITDSQAFGIVSKTVPESVPLTSFSILFARYKGDLAEAVKGARKLDSLKDGDKILISEGCTHHRQCGDIGTVKLPNWIKKHTGKHPEFTFTSGGEFPSDLSGYSLIIHCGACMINAREMASRIQRAKAAGVPITNYGTAIAHMHGILDRSLSPFDDIK